MKVAAVLAAKGHKVLTVAPFSHLATIAQQMRMEGVGAFVVLEKEKIVGIVSERDVVHAFAMHREETVKLEVADVMSKNVITCHPDDSLTHIFGLMTRQRVRHLPVIEEGNLIGIISIGDAVKHRFGELETEAAVLREAYIARH